MSKYRKAIAALIGAVATWAATYFPNDPRVGLASALGTVIVVYLVPNEGGDDA